MDFPKIHESEYRFCLIMWEYEPVTAAQLVELCQEQLGWKRTEYDHIDRRYLRTADLGNVTQVQHIREMPFGDGDRACFNLTRPHRLYAAVQGRQRKHADSIKQTAEFKYGHAHTSCGPSCRGYGSCRCGFSCRAHGQGSRSARPGLSVRRSADRCCST